MMEQKKRISEGNTNAQVESEGSKEYGNPSQQVYHDKDEMSSTYVKKYIGGGGLRAKNCAWCGKEFYPTPLWGYGDCHTYSCMLRYDEQKREKVFGKKPVIMYDPETLQDLIKFDSAREAGDSIGLDARRIRNACNGLAATAGGKHWRWADEIPWQKEPEAPPTERRVNISVYVNESTNKALQQLAKKYDVTRNRMASIMVEKAIEKKEYGNVEEDC